MPVDGQRVTSERQDWLDYLRILAISTVFVYHIFRVGIEASIERDAPVASQLALITGDFWDNGTLGVSVFFLISGFVIVMTARRETVLSFATKRFVRIYPLFAIALIVSMIPIGWDHIIPAIPGFLAQSTLLGDFIGVRPALMGVEWTLRLEILFYALVGLTLSVRNRRQLRRSGYIFGMGILLIALALAPAFPQFGSDIDPYFSDGHVTIFFPLFLGGAALALRSEGLINWVSTFGLFLGSLLISQYNLLRLRPDLESQQAPLVLAYLLFLLAYVFRTHFPRIRLVSWAASLTYIVYLLHFVLMPDFLFWGERLWSQFFGFLDLPDGLVQTIVTLGSLGVFFTFVGLLERFVERPMLSAVRTYFRNRRAHTPPSTGSP